MQKIIFFVLSMVLAQAKCDENVEILNSKYIPIVRVDLVNGKAIEPQLNAVDLVRQWLDELELSVYSFNLRQARLMKDGYILFEMDKATQASHIVDVWQNSKLAETFKAEQSTNNFFDDFPAGTFAL